jgi:hypothetical protein
LSMKHINPIRLSLAIAFFSSIPALAFSQSPLARSGQPQVVGAALSPASDLPCAGVAVLEDDFESGLVGWTVIDGDGRTPVAQSGLQGGWQSRRDYRDTNNLVAASPSWYTPAGRSNDWLISPATTIGANSCLSWVSYSQDPSFLEAYEIRIASTPDTSALLAGAALVTVTAAPTAKTLRSASLAAYAGQTVYIAFRQTSLDKFVLLLDDIKVSNVMPIDVGVFAVSVPSSDPGDTIRLSMEVANYGADTVREFVLSYQVESGAIQTMAIDSIVLAPNKTITITHSADFVSDTVEAFYDYCAWTSLPNGVADQGVANDSLCARFAAGTPVGADQPRAYDLDLLAYPVPASGRLYVQIALARPETAVVVLRDMHGRVVRQQAVRLGLSTQLELDVDGLSAGMYVLYAQTASGKIATQKVTLR